jgi:2-aminoethylphosphonate-pyruvate transaminase
LNPGPVTLSERVRAALLRDDWCHREVEFAELTQSINARLASLYAGAPNGSDAAPGAKATSAACDFEAVLLTGSGTAALEAMLTGFAPDDTTTLVVANGVYGERIANILERQRKSLRLVASAWTEPMDLARVADCLAENPDVSHIAAVHHETTTGRLNDLAALARLARDSGRELLVDAVSSFGAEEIDFEAWPIAAVAATANKCLHAVPGVCFVLARRELWRAGPPKSARSLYLDPFAYHAAQHGDGYSPFTQSVQAAFALDEALDELADEGGWRARRESYRGRAARIERELGALGFESLLPAEVRSCVLTGYRLPAGTPYPALHEQLKRDGFVIYAGQGHLASDICRVANMGDIRAADFTRLFESFRRATGPGAAGANT